MDLWFGCRESIKRKKIRPCAGFSDTTSFKFDIFDILRQRIEFVYEHLHEMKPGRVPPSGEARKLLYNILYISIYYIILYLIYVPLSLFIFIYYFSLFLLISPIFCIVLGSFAPLATSAVVFTEHSEPRPLNEPAMRSGEAERGREGPRGAERGRDSGNFQDRSNTLCTSLHTRNI
jgi:hypothetical protein